MHDTRSCTGTATGHRARRWTLTVAGTLALGGCHVQRTILPAAVPQAALAAPVRLRLSRPIPLTWTSSPAPRGDSTATLHDPAVTSIVGRLRWSSADSLEIEMRHVYGKAGWQRTAQGPRMRLAWQDVTRVEQKQFSRARTMTVLLVIAAVLGWVVVDALNDADDLYYPSN